MKSRKTFYTLIAAAGVSIGTLAIAQEEAILEEGEQSRCDILAATIEQAPAENQIVNLENNAPTEAFCVGLQSHSDDSSRKILFSDDWSKYEARSKTIMSPYLSYWYGGFANARCKLNGQPNEVCIRDQNPALTLNLPTHPDYSSPEFNGSTINVASSASQYIPAGNYDSLTTGTSAVIKLTNNTVYNIKQLNLGQYAVMHLTDGDYFIENLSMGQHSKIIVDGGTARLHLKNNPSIANWAKLNWNGDTKKLLIVANGDFSVYNHVSIAGFIYSEAKVTLNRYCKVEGAINAESITLYDNSLVTEKLTRLPYVDFGEEITANPAAWNSNNVLYAPSIDRHSGNYTLTYPVAQVNQAVDVDRYVGFSSNLENNLMETFLDSSEYVDTTVTEEVDEPASTSGPMVVGKIYGAISISVSGVTVFPLLVDFNIAFNMENGGVPTLAVDDSQILDDLSEKQDALAGIADDLANHTVIITDANGTVLYFTEADDPAEIGTASQNAQLIEYGHLLLDDVYISVEDRDGALVAYVIKQNEEFSKIYARIVGAWNAAKKVKIPGAVEFSTHYPNAGTYGFTGRRFDTGGTWIGAMKDNNYAGLPIAFPINLFPVVGYYSAAWCGAWVAAFEVGCFQPEFGEPDASAAPMSGTCTATLAEGAAAVPVDAAFHSFAGANLTCGVLVFNTLMTATVGFGIETLPVGDKF